MAFHTPHGSARFRLPWSWSSFDYRELCAALWEQTDARFEIAKVRGRTGETVHTDRGDLDRAADRRRARLAARARPRRQRAAAGGAHLAAVSRSTRTTRAATTSTCGSTARWSATATPGRSRRRGERRVGVGSYEPRHHVKEPTREMARRLETEAVRYQGNWFPHELRPAAEDGVFFVGDAAGPLHPAVGRGDPHRLLLRDRAAGREIRAVLAGDEAPRGRARPPTATSPPPTRRSFRARPAPAAPDPGAAAARADRAAEASWAASSPAAGVRLVPGPGSPRLARRHCGDRGAVPAMLNGRGDSARGGAWHPRSQSARFAGHLESQPDGHRLRRARAGPLRHPGLGLGRGADARVHERRGARQARARPASCTCGAARATSCGTRARRRATRRP